MCPKKHFNEHFWQFRIYMADQTKKELRLGIFSPIIVKIWNPAGRKRLHIKFRACFST